MSVNVLHRLIDAAAGLRNIAPHEAEGLHEEVEPGSTAVPLSDEEQAQLAALQAKQASAKAKAAAVDDGEV
jgi:hypothetical protein